MTSWTEVQMRESFAEVGLLPQERELVAIWAPLLDREVVAVADRYYAHMRTTEAGRELTPEKIERFLVQRIAHWRLLVHGDFAGVADDYVERFGRRLFEAGVPMRILIIAADWFAVEFSRIVDRCPEIPDDIRSELRTALVKYAFLDLALAQASREVSYLD